MSSVNSTMSMSSIVLANIYCVNCSKEVMVVSTDKAIRSCLICFTTASMVNTIGMYFIVVICAFNTVHTKGYVYKKRPR